MLPREERKPCEYFPEKRVNMVDAPERREQAMWMLPIEERKPCGGSPEKIGNPVDAPDRREETLWMVLREKGKPLEYVWMLPREE